MQSSSFGLRKRLCAAFSDTDNSFLQQVIQILFQKWQDIHRFALYHTNAYDMIDSDAVIRLASRDLTEGRGLPPYTLFNQISATYSEGSVCHGTLAFSEGATAENMIAFETPILLQTENVRYVRKLIEMTSGEKMTIMSYSSMLQANPSLKLWVSLPGLAARICIQWNFTVW